MKKLCVFCMALLMLAMTACGKDTSGGGQSVDLRAAYEAAIAQVNEELGDNARLVVSEPLRDLEGAWNEVPESSWGVVRANGDDELHPFTPT